MALALGGCGAGAYDPAAYQHPLDSLIAFLRLDAVGLYPCMTTEIGRNGRPFWVRDYIERCVRMEQATRYSGVWLVQQEASLFFPAQAGQRLRKGQVMRAFNDPRSKPDWLSFARGAAPPLPHSDAVLVEMAFIGRRTTVEGRYGHMGMSERQIVVDRIFHARIIDRSASYQE